jgi:hypothetical protein
VIDSRLTKGSVLSRAVESWNGFWFTPANPTPLGLIRILTGLIAFYVVFAYSFDFQELLGPDAWFNLNLQNELRKDIPFRAPPPDWADATPPEPPRNATEEEYIKKWEVNPRSTVARGYPIWSIWFHVTEPTAMVAVHVAILFVISLFTIGLGTRVTSVLAWFGVISYTQRAMTTLFGMDTMLNLLMVYLMIGPSGAALSVDRLIARYWTTWRSLRDRRAAPGSLKPKPLLSANLAIRLIQVNLCIIYIASGLSKLRGNTWWTWQAIWLTLANPEFAPMHNSTYMAIVRFLCEHRWLWEIGISAATLFTLAMEIGFPFLVWVRPMRWVMLTMAFMLHTGIAVFMGLHTFSLCMMTMLIAFVPPETVLWLVQLPARAAARFRLEFQARDRGHVRTASVIHAVDVWDQVSLDPTPRGADGVVAQGLRADAAHVEPTVVRLVSTDGAAAEGFGIVRQLCRFLPLLLPLAPVAWFLGAVGIGQIQRRRARRKGESVDGAGFCLARPLLGSGSLCDQHGPGAANSSHGV